MEQTKLKKYGVVSLYILPNGDEKCSNCYTDRSFIGANIDFIDHINTIHSKDFKTMKQVGDFLDENNILYHRLNTTVNWNSIKQIQR